jgi:hypothetical protein
MTVHLLRFEKGGSYLTLSQGTNVNVAHYVPATPQISTVKAEQTTVDGGEQPLTTRRNVTETIELYLTPGSSMATVEAVVLSLETWLRLAEEYQNNKAGGSPTYCEYQPLATTGVWRSEILGGFVVLRDDAMKRWQRQQSIRVDVVITRRWYWEAAEVELPLSVLNPNGPIPADPWPSGYLYHTSSPATGGVTIYDHYDGGHGNWVQVDGDDVLGSLPARARIEITNTYNDSINAGAFMIAQNTFGMNVAHNQFIQAIEGESAADPTTTDYSDTDSSSDAGITLTVPTPSSAFMARWTLSGTSLLAYACRNYRLIGRFDDVSHSDITVKAALTYPFNTALNAAVIAQTSEVLLSASATLQDLGILCIPPGMPDTTFDALALSLYGYSPSAGRTVDLDCIFLMPVDAYRVLTPKSTAYGLAYNAKLVDDGIRNVVYMESSGGRMNHYTGFGSPITLWPGVRQTIFILSQALSGPTSILRSHSVRLYYRPRRLTV